VLVQKYKIYKKNNNIIIQNFPRISHEIKNANLITKQNNKKKRMKIN